MKLLFNNPWMTLHANSMRKLHKIEFVAFDEDTHTKLFKKGFINVAGVPELDEELQLIARQYGGDNATKLKSFNSDSSPFLDLYIRCDGKYFQVSGVFKSFDDCNKHSKFRDDVGLMCSFTVGDTAEELHFMTSHTPNKVRTKSITVGA